jgi:flagellar biosynthesis protein FliR
MYSCRRPISRSLTSPTVHLQAAVCIAVCGGVAGYAAYYAFQRPCNTGKAFGISLGLGDNIFEEKDGEMIAVFILDIIACIMFLSCAGNVARRAM